jgi:hypothetical protein
MFIPKRTIHFRKNGMSAENQQYGGKILYQNHYG